MTLSIKVKKLLKPLPIKRVLLAFLFIFGLVFTFSYSPPKAFAFFNFGNVLGDDDEKSDHEDKSENDDDKDKEDKDKDGDSDDRAEELDNKNKEEEKENDEKSDHEDKDKEDKVEEIEHTINNSLGGTTKIKKRVEAEDGEEEYEIKVYDSYGNKVEERSYESGDDGEAELEIKRYEKGRELGELEFKTKDGRVVKLKIEQQDKDKSHLEYDSLENVLTLIKKSQNKNEEGEEEEVDIEVDEDKGEFKIKQNQYEAYIKFPMTISEEGNIVVTTPKKDVILKSMPEAVVRKAMEEHDVDSVGNVEVVENDETENLEYKIQAVKREKVLGLFEANIPLLLQYDASTGTFEKSSQDFFYKLLDLISF